MARALGIGGAPTGSSVVWAPFPADTDYFAPNSSPFMVNLMAADRGRY